MNGDNSDANYDYNNQGVCGARSDRRALWYEINGIGKEVTVNVCTNNDKSEYHLHSLLNIRRFVFVWCRLYGYLAGVFLFPCLKSDYSVDNLDYNL